MKTTLIERLQNAARSLGLDIRRARPRPPAASNVLALTISDVLLRIVRDGGSTSDFAVVQIGANDGITYDPIHRFIVKYGFRGVLVEPQPDAFSKLKKNYAALPQIAVEQAAIAEADGEQAMYRFKPGPHLPEWADCLTSFSRETLVNNLHHVRGEVETISVPALTFSSLLRKHQLEHVHLLQIDTEGFDDRIVKMIDFRTIKPTIIQFEIGLLAARSVHECYRLLSAHGYKITPNGPDVVAYQEPAEQSLFDTRAWHE